MKSLKSNKNQDEANKTKKLLHVNSIIPTTTHYDQWKSNWYNWLASTHVMPSKSKFNLQNSRTLRDNFLDGQQNIKTN
jgi:hypothetical protein